MERHVRRVIYCRAQDGGSAHKEQEDCGEGIQVGLIPIEISAAIKYPGVPIIQDPPCVYSSQSI